MDPNPVSLVDIRIPFWRLVAFFIKAAIAAVPAAIVVAVLYYFVALILVGGVMLGRH
jgi:hypothetical protein